MTAMPSFQESMLPLNSQLATLISGTNEAGDLIDGLPVQFGGGLTAGIDAGGRIRVSETSELLEVRFLQGINTKLVNTAVVGTGGANYSAANAHVALTTAADSDAAVLQSKQFASYESGKSHVIEGTFTNFGVETNVIKRFGYFSSSVASPYSASIDGVYIESDGVTDNEVKFIINKSGTPTKSVLQSAWDDPLDGTGKSGITINWSKFTIVLIDFLYLGGSAYRLFVFQDGRWHLAHTYKHAGVGTGVSMLSPNQPIRYEIRQSGAGSGTFNAICAQASTEGAVNQLGYTVSINTGAAFVNANTAGTCYALVGVKLKSTARNLFIKFVKSSINSIGTNKDYLWELRLNPTVAGTFNYADVSGENIQSAIADTSGNPGTNTVTGGTVLDFGYANSESPGQTVLETAARLGSTIAGVMDSIVLCATPQTANQDISGGVILAELV